MPTMRRAVAVRHLHDLGLRMEQLRDLLQRDGVEEPGTAESLHDLQGCVAGQHMPRLVIDQRR
jgi:hypothetical protein